jgi:hypothetical protein
MFKVGSVLLICVLWGIGLPSVAQNDSIDYWDNQLYIGNKIAWSHNDWRYSGELQLRLADNTRNLQYYFGEIVATYLLNEHWEFAPDLRFSIYPERTELRPGIGVLYKHLWKKKKINQFVQQVKYQVDLESTGSNKQGLRYILFYNKVVNDRWVFSSGGGGFYRWSESFNGIQFIRAFAGMNFSFDETHILSLSYFVGAENQGEYWSYIGGPFLQFIIRFNDDTEYTPAKYINF